jgi:hypothetical protein
MTSRFYFILLALTLGTGINTSYAQITSISDTLLGQTAGRPITTAVPFLTISPDARSGAMGDAGVAISPDANAIFWNPAKLAFIEQRLGGAISYTPWLRNLVNDMYIANLSGFYKVDDRQAVGASFTYFDLGSMQFTDDNGQIMQDFNPQEFSIGGTYSRKLSENLGLAVGLRFIHSNLSGNFSAGPGFDQSKPGNSAAGDVAVYYTKDLNLSGRDVNFSFGANVSNIGGKISYTTRDRREFLPTNLRIGPAFTYNIDPYNKFTFTVDLNKLLVPTPPIYVLDANGRIQRDASNNPVIAAGRDPNRTFLSGALGSFTDAPGGFSEEIREFIIATGVEYWYNDVFAARAGYFSENREKGARKYFTVGVGIRFNQLGFDFAYLVPQTRGVNNPLAETIRFTLRLNMNNQSDEEGVID